MHCLFACPHWQWHHPKALDELIDHCLNNGFWSKTGNYIQKNPPKHILSFIEFMRGSFQTESLDTTLDIGSIHFPTGQAFQDWMADKQMQVNELKHAGEIVQ